MKAMKALCEMTLESNHSDPVIMRDCWEREVTRWMWAEAAGDRSEVLTLDGWLVVRRL